MAFDILTVKLNLNQHVYGKQMLFEDTMKYLFTMSPINYICHTQNKCHNTWYIVGHSGILRVTYSSALNVLIDKIISKTRGISIVYIYGKYTLSCVNFVQTYKHVYNIYYINITSLYYTKVEEDCAIVSILHY